MIKFRDVLKTRFIVNFIVANNIYFKGTKSKKVLDYYVASFIKRVPCNRCPGTSCKHQFHNVEDSRISMCFYNTPIIKQIIKYLISGQIDFIINAKKKVR